MTTQWECPLCGNNGVLASEKGQVQCIACNKGEPVMVRIRDEKGNLSYEGVSSEVDPVAMVDAYLEERITRFNPDEEVEPDEGVADETLPPTDDELRWNRVVEARRRVQQAEEELAEAKDAHSTARKVYDMAVVALTDLIDEENQDREPTLFDGQPAKSNYGDAEPWKQWLLRDIDGLCDENGILNALTKAGIETLGDLTKMNEDGTQLCDIKGIGVERATVIEDAIMQFWADHPEYEEDPS